MKWRRLGRYLALPPVVVSYDGVLSIRLAYLPGWREPGYVFCDEYKGVLAERCRADTRGPWRIFDRSSQRILGAMVRQVQPWLHEWQLVGRYWVAPSIGYPLPRGYSVRPAVDRGTRTPAYAVTSGCTRVYAAWRVGQFVTRPRVPSSVVADVERVKEEIYEMASR